MSASSTKSSISIVFVFFGSSADELVGLDDHVAVGAQLVALDDVLVGHLVAGRRVDALLLDAHPRLRVQLVEANGLATDGAVELHRNGDEAEGDRTGPNGSRHATHSPPSPCAANSHARGLAASVRGAARIPPGEIGPRRRSTRRCRRARAPWRGGPRRTPRRSWRRTRAGRRGCGWRPGLASTWTSSSTQVAAGVAQVGLQRRPRGQRAALQRRRPRRASTARGRSRRAACWRDEVAHERTASGRAQGRGSRRRRAGSARRSRRRRRRRPPCRR